MKQNKIGKKIKQFREFRKISLEDLALNANLDLVQLEQIEEKGNVPSLGHLIKLSRALGIRLGTFLDDQDHIGPVVIKAGNEKSTSMPNPSRLQSSITFKMRKLRPSES